MPLGIRFSEEFRRACRQDSKSLFKLAGLAVVPPVPVAAPSSGAATSQGGLAFEGPSGESFGKAVLDYEDW